jgi:hypothetical protein
MRTVTGFCFALLAITGLQAQNRSGFVTPPNVTRTFGSVVNPGSSSALPGVQRTVGSVVHPGGGTPPIGIPGLRIQGVPGANIGRGFQRNPGGFAYPVAVPVYVGGYGGYGYGYGYDPMAQPQAPMYQQQQPNVVVVYPPAPAYSGYPAYTYQQPAQSNIADVPPAETQTQDQGAATHYLLAFKDHSIYSAVAYWVEGDTLHYFTSGNTHNQVSVALIDRDLTKRLNEASGLEVKLPPAK